MRIETVRERKARESRKPPAVPTLDGWTPKPEAIAAAERERYRLVHSTRRGGAHSAAQKKQWQAEGRCRECGVPRGEAGTTVRCRGCADHDAYRQRRRRGTLSARARGRIPMQGFEVSCYATERAEYLQFAKTFGMTLSALAREAIEAFIEDTETHEDWR